MRRPGGCSVSGTEKVMCQLCGERYYAGSGVIARSRRHPRTEWPGGWCLDCDRAFAVRRALGESCEPPSYTCSTLMFGRMRVLCMRHWAVMGKVPQ